ncbi:MAG: rod shape-determining protein MreC [Coriobacteriaceae bacterium]|nr:rod shape-determining protein MreC [Coriobacteriaceae bacterium]
MALSPKKPKKLSGGFLLILFIVLSIVLMTVWIREGASGPLHSVRSGFATITMPFQYAGAMLSRPFQAVGNLTANLGADQEDISTLTAENEELRALVMQLEEYRQENERLSKMLELADTYSLDSTGARVISRSADTWNRILTIDKGSSSGLRVGMPVLSANGLLGQIESVSQFSSTVRLITDSQSGVAAFLQSSRTEGIVSGSAEGLVYLSYIPLTATVQPGDVVVTSGAGGVYPKGIAIGEVASVDFSPTDVYQTIIIKPITRVSTYEEVLVLVGNQSEVKINVNVGSQSSDGSTDQENPASNAESSNSTGGSDDAVSGSSGNPDTPIAGGSDGQ